MRLSWLLIAFVASMTCDRANVVPIAAEPPRPSRQMTSNVDFAQDVLPIVQRCEPCHFPGGSMYTRLPFDRAETIQKLGTRLFTRIKDENDQAMIRAFLDERSP